MHIVERMQWVGQHAVMQRSAVLCLLQCSGEGVALCGGICALLCAVVWALCTVQMWECAAVRFALFTECVGAKSKLLAKKVKLPPA